MMIIEWVLSPFTFVYFISMAVLSVILQKRFPLVCYTIWTFVLIKMLFPFGMYEFHLIPSQNSIIQNTQQITQLLSFPPSHREFDLDIKSQIQNDNNEVYKKSLNQSPHSETLDTSRSADYKQISIGDVVIVFSIIWVVTSFYVFLHVCVSYLLLCRSISRMKSVSTGKQYDLYLECCDLVNSQTIPKLKLSDQKDHTPFAIGFTNKTATVVIPSQLFETGTKNELKATFVHELCHIKKRDAWINLLRFLCFCAFHIHPIRIFADYQINRFQEICRDMDVIYYLKMKPKEYAKILVASYYNATIQRESPVLYSSFFNTNSNFIKRLVFLRENLQSSHFKLQKWTSIFVLLSVLLVLLNPSISAIPLQQQTINLSELRNIPDFPTPIPHDNLSTSPVPIVKTFDNEVWVAEPFNGLFVYQLNPTGIFELSLQYLIEVDDSHKITDFDVYENTVVLSIGNFRKLSNSTKCTIQILNKSDESLNLTHLIDSVNTFSVQVTNGIVWAGGSIDFSGNLIGLLSLYKIENVMVPELLDEIFLEQIPIQIVHSKNDPSNVHVLYGKQLEIFENENQLQTKQVIDLNSTGKTLVQDADNNIFIFSLQDGLSSGGNPPTLIELIQESNSSYTIARKTEFTHQEYSSNFIITSIVPYKSGVFLTFNQPGFVYLSDTYTDYNVLFWSDRFVKSVFIVNQKLFRLNDNSMYQYNLNEFLNENTIVSNWQEYKL